VLLAEHQVQTEPVPGAAAPVWNFSEAFRDVATSATLKVELWLLQANGPGMGSTKRFLGCAEVALQQTLPAATAAAAGGLGSHSMAAHRADSAAPVPGGSVVPEPGSAGSAASPPAPRPAEPRWFSLAREDGRQQVSGCVLLAFEWQFTSEGLLAKEVAALEGLLAEKLEMLARLRALPPDRAALLLAGGRHAAAAAAGGPAAAVTELPDDYNSDGEEEEEEQGGGEGGDREPGEEGAGRDNPLLGSLDRSVLDLGQGHHMTLEVTVLEVRNLRPRRFTDGTGSWAGYTADRAQRSQPLALVRVDCGGGEPPQTVAAGCHSTNPVFPRTPLQFRAVPPSAAVHIQVCDVRAVLDPKPLAEARLPAAAIRGTDPVYMWLPLEHHEDKGLVGKLQRSINLRSGRRAALAAAYDAPLALVRFQIVRPQLRGTSMSLQAQLAGCSVAANTDGSAELLNFTISDVLLSSVMGKGEHRVSALVRAVQLDNQMLAARHPVVLSPSSNPLLLRQAQRSTTVAAALEHQPALPGARAEVSEAGAAASGSEPDLPLVQFSMVRSFASSGTIEGAAAADQQDGRTAAASGAGAGSGADSSQSQILAFKHIELLLAPLDFETDEAFLQALATFYQTLPMADLWQGPEWQANVERQQGLRQAEDAAGAPAAAAAARRPASEHGALAWLASREVSELAELRGQSSTWFFFESLLVSSLNVSVTIALTGDIMNVGAGGADGSGSGAAGAGRDGGQYQTQLQRGLVKRLVGSLPLVNVNNAPIELRGICFQGQLLNKVGLVNHVWNHYSAVAAVQAVKILDGALGATPLNIITSPLWALGSIADVGASAVRDRSASQVVPQAGYVLFTAAGQMVGVASKFIMALMSVVPTERSGKLSDNAVLSRYLLRPQTAPEAFGQAARTLVGSMVAAATGVLLDPAAGARLPGMLGLLAFFGGVVKGLAGLMARPAAGVFEAMSRVLTGFGLLFLGKQGIQGKLLRRVRAPGLAGQESIVQQPRPAAGVVRQQAALLAAWQRHLRAVLPGIASDTVEEVLAARPDRVVLLTSHHVAYLRAQRAAGGGAGWDYRAKWTLERDLIVHVRGSEDSLQLSIEYQRPMRAGRFQVNLPLRKGMRCANRDAYHKVVASISRAVAGPEVVAAAAAEAAKAAAEVAAAGKGDRLDDLSLVKPAAGQAGAAVGGGV
jgi:hypothetical protein